MMLYGIRDARAEGDILGAIVAIAEALERAVERVEPSARAGRRRRANCRFVRPIVRGVRFVLYAFVALVSP